MNITNQQKPQTQQQQPFHPQTQAQLQFQPIPQHTQQTHFQQPLSNSVQQQQQQQQKSPLLQYVNQQQQQLTTTTTTTTAATITTTSSTASSATLTNQIRPTISRNNFISKFKKINSLLNSNDILELNNYITREYIVDERELNDNNETSNGIINNTGSNNINGRISRRKSKKVIKRVPKIKQFIPFPREYIHQFSRNDQSYKDSLLYMSSQLDQIDHTYEDDDYLEDKSEISKLHYLSETIARYRQIFGFPQHEPMKIKPNNTNKELNKLKMNIIKSINIGNNDIKSKFQDQNYLLKQGTIERPYLSIRSRIALQNDKIYFGFQQLHYPMTQIEKIIIRNSNVGLGSRMNLINKLCKQLPGRVPMDVVRYFIDLKEMKKDSRLIYDDERLNGKIDASVDINGNSINPFERDVNNNKRLDIEYRICQEQLKQIQQLDLNQKQLQRILINDELGRKQNSSVNGIRFNQGRIIKSMAKDIGKIGSYGSGGENILDVKFDPTNKSNKILTLSKGASNAFLYNYENQSIQNLKFHTKQCNEGHFSLDGSKVITASKDGTIAVWSTDDAKFLGYFEHENHSPCLRLSLHRYLDLAVGGFQDKSLYLYNYQSQDYINVNNSQDMATWPCAVTDLSFGYGRNCDKIAGGIGSTTEEPVKGFVTIIDINKPDRYLNLFVQEKDVSSVAWNPRNHDVIASASNDINQSICVYDIRTTVRAVTIKTGQLDVNICCYSPCANYISLSGTINSSFIFDARNSKKPLHELRHKIYDSNYNPVSKIVTHAQWSKNGEFFATSADDGCVRLWDIGSSQPLIKALEHKAFPGTPVNFFDISPHSDMIVSGGDDGYICLFGYN
ncbi:hypothetical protein ACTA71_009735 [Dictyostelium dimigraforme]